MHVPGKFGGGLTVLIAVYERDDHRLFGKAMESIYQNTLKPDQTVLVVDGPVPEELDAVIRHAERNYGVKALRLPQNRGLANALNEGLKEVRTEWVARADADDINLPDRFSLQHRMILVNPDLDLIGGVIEEVEEDGRPVALRRVPVTQERIREWMPKRNPFNHMTILARTAAVKAVGGYPELHLKEDYGLWARIVAAGGRCMNSEVVLVRASAGRKMYDRRGGLRYAKSEIFLQKELVRLGISSVPSALFIGCSRALIFLLPAWLKALFYMRFLRSAPNTARPA